MKNCQYVDIIRCIQTENIHSKPLNRKKTKFSYASQLRTFEEPSGFLKFFDRPIENFTSAYFIAKFELGFSMKKVCIFLDNWFGRTNVMLLVFSCRLANHFNSSQTKRDIKPILILKAVEKYSDKKNYDRNLTNRRSALTGFC